MREIKFRGKRLDNGEWVYGSLVQCDITGKRYILPMGSDANESDKVRHEGCLMLFTFEVIPETIGQYTGLKDKNGVEIYEGDVVEYEDYSGGLLLFKEQPKSRGVIEIEDILSGIYLKGMGSIKGHKIEVIGNIFDNPEPLEV